MITMFEKYPSFPAGLTRILASVGVYPEWLTDVKELCRCVSRRHSRSGDLSCVSAQSLRMRVQQARNFPSIDGKKG